jgi:hypothetical protein
MVLRDINQKHLEKVVGSIYPNESITFLTQKRNKKMKRNDSEGREKSRERR